MGTSRGRWCLIAGLLPAGLWLVGRSLDALLGPSSTVESVATDPDLAPYLAGFLIAALVIGVLWGLWHVPTFIAKATRGPIWCPCW